MKKTYRINFPKVINLLFLALILQCCTPMSKITYLNEADLTGFDISPKPPKHVFVDQIHKGFIDYSLLLRLIFNLWLNLSQGNRLALFNHHAAL